MGVHQVTFVAAQRSSVAWGAANDRPVIGNAAYPTVMSAGQSRWPGRSATSRTDSAENMDGMGSGHSTR